MPSRTVEDLSEAIAAAMEDIDEQEKRMAVSLYELLAEGEPVTAAQVAARSGVEEAIVDEALNRLHGVFRDEDGFIIGFWGLAIPEMAHGFQAEGGKPIHAWCALDPFLIVPVIGRSARVSSTDPVTGRPITMTVTPDGLADVEPASAVVSFVVPDGPFNHNVIQTFCHYVLNFASQESAERWAAGRDDIILLPVEDAFEVGRRAWSALRKSG